MGEIHDDILENCTSDELIQLQAKCKKLEEELGTEKSNQIANCSSSCSEELLTHKVRYLEKELEISNKKLSKFQPVCDKT